MKELLFFETIRKDAVWGSEYWTVAAHQNGDCVVKAGTFKGEKLSSLWENHRELFGNVSGDRFPLLVKVIDAKSDLSIQVHPDDAYACKNENGSLGKTECWYVLNAPEKEVIMLGHNASSREEARAMISEGRWDDFLKKVPISKGDLVLINPGTIHSICGGTSLIEIQQSSDITYRLYDYGRLVDGKLRELHIEKSLDVIEIPDKSQDHHYSDFPEGGYETPFFKISKCQIDNENVKSFGDTFTIISVTDGEGTIDGCSIKRGDSFIVPAGYGDAVFKGKLEILLTGL